jgi:hypothetical protein
VSVADSSGDLLFYANTRATLPGHTTLVWNQLHELMDNGDSVVGRGWYKELVIVPWPGNDSLYALFSGAVTTVEGFYYSVIDMSQDSGKGSVVQKNIMLQGPGFWSSDGLAAIRHGNGRDWWIAVRNWSNFNNDYYFYLVTPSGANLDHVQQIGDTVRPGFFRIEPSVQRQILVENLEITKSVLQVFPNPASNTPSPP